MPDATLYGKVALVTGGGSPIGLGYVMAEAYARAGARVALVDRNEEWLRESGEQLRSVAGGDGVITVTCDVSNPASAKQAVDRTIAELGGLHILVNNAGTAAQIESPDAVRSVQTNTWEMPIETWQRVISVNLNGAFYFIRAAVPHLLAQGWGRIVGVTTSLDTMYRKGFTPYGPSKAGHEALVAIVAQELEGTGITANIIVPGGVASTNMIPPTADEKIRSTMIPPSVMAPPALWLASEAAADFTNQRIVARLWNPDAPLEERLAQATAPAAWQGLGSQAVLTGLM